MRIGIVGNGVVGHATARCLIEHVEDVWVYDIVKERCLRPLDQVLEADLVFICLPTPMKEDGSCDVSYVDDFFDSLGKQSYGYTNFVLRSTVPVGTTRRLSALGFPNLVHSPEFLTARCSVTDAHLPARNIIGLTGGVDIERLPLFQLYKRRFPSVPIHVMFSDASELVKLMQNSFFAVKVAFFNECQSYACKMGIDWNTVLAAVLADGRIAHAHTQVPGPDNKYGFGGACLPKDLSNFISCYNRAGATPLVAEAALQRNIQDRNRPSTVCTEQVIRETLARDMTEDKQ